MIRKFLNDARGNFAMMTAIAIVPIMGALALAVDYAHMRRLGHPVSADMEILVLG